MILLDYLESRPDVDAARIGMTGLSLGGMHTWLAAALDDRVAVAAPMIGVQVSVRLAQAGASLHLFCIHRVGLSYVLSQSNHAHGLQLDSPRSNKLLGVAELRFFLACVQNFKWAVDNDSWQARIASIPQVFAAAAKDMDCSAVDRDVVRKVWGCLLPGLLEVNLSSMITEDMSWHHEMLSWCMFPCCLWASTMHMHRGSSEQGKAMGCQKVLCMSTSLFKEPFMGILRS